MPEGIHMDNQTTELLFSTVANDSIKYDVATNQTRSEILERCIVRCWEKK